VTGQIKYGVNELKLIRRIPNQEIVWKLDDRELELFHEIEKIKKEVEEYGYM